MIVRRVLGMARNPAQLVVGAFVTLITIGTLLLRLPIAVDDGAAPLGWRHALFSATSASTVTGLATVDIDDFSLFGELVLLGLIQLGGFGIMTIGSVVALIASRRVGLRQRMLAQAEIGAVQLGELRSLVAAIALITVAVESLIAGVLFTRLATSGTGIARSAYEAVFHAVSAFNNAGIALSADSLSRFAGDPFVVFPVTGAFIVGGLGFPVLVELRRRRSAHGWSLHTRIVVATTAVLLVAGPLIVLVVEWTNPATLGPLGLWDKLQAAWFQGVTPRTAGFNTIDIGAMREPTLSAITALMFIGAGPASTSGGIKVTTFAVIGFAMWAEVRGERDINLFRRRLDPAVLRQALTVAVLSVSTVLGTAVVLHALSDFALHDTLFEATSAFGTVGLSTGITAQLPASGQLLLIAVMLAGRVGPITFVAAIALRERRRAYRWAVDRPIIG